MPMTYAEHEKKKKSPAVCELFSLRDLPEGENIMVRTNGAFVAGYELRGILGYFATDGDRNQTKAMLEASFEACPMSVCASSSATRSRNAWATFSTATSTNSAPVSRR